MWQKRMFGDINMILPMNDINIISLYLQPCMLSSYGFSFNKSPFLILWSFISISAPTFTISPKPSPSQASTVPRHSADTSNEKHMSLITIICIFIGALIAVLVIAMFICFCKLRKGKRKVPPVETRTCRVIYSQLHSLKTIDLLYFMRSLIIDSEVRYTMSIAPHNIFGFLTKFKWIMLIFWFIMHVGASF